MLPRFRYRTNRPLRSLTKDQLAARDKIAAKMKHGYSFDTVTHCFCDAETFTEFAQRERFGLPATTVMCNNCGSLLQSPRFSLTSIVDFYARDYRALYSPTIQNNLEKFFQEEAKIGQTALDFFGGAGIKLQRGKVIDIGCATGGALQPFQRQGWQVYGCDLNPEHITFGQTKGLTLWNTSFEHIPTNDHVFDVALLNDILEHQRDPLQFLQQLRRRLADQSYVYVQLPGLRDVVTNDYPDILRDLQIAHLFYWDLKQLEALFAKAGFRLVHGNEKIQAVFTPTDDTQLAQHTLEAVKDYAQVMKKFLESVEKDRWRLFFKNNRSLMFHQPLHFAEKLALFIRYK